MRLEVKKLYRVPNKNTVLVPLDWKDVNESGFGERERVNIIFDNGKITILMNKNIEKFFRDQLNNEVQKIY